MDRTDLPDTEQIFDAVGFCLCEAFQDLSPCLARKSVCVAVLDLLGVLVWIW